VAFFALVRVLASHYANTLLNAVVSLCAQRMVAWRRLPNGCSNFAQNFLAAFAKPLLCAGAVYQH